MGIDQHVAVGSRPFCRGCEVVPHWLGHHSRRDVQFLEVRSRAEERPYFIGDGFLVAGHFRRGPAVADAHAMEHQRVERVQRAELDDAVVAVHVAVGNPLLAGIALAVMAGIAALSPDRVGVERPERTGPRAAGGVDEDLRALASQRLGQGENRVDIVGHVDLGTGDLLAAAHAVELEEDHAMLAHHVQAGIAKGLAVLLARHGETAGVGLVALGLPEGDTHVLGPGVTAKG